MQCPGIHCYKECSVFKQQRYRYSELFRSSGKKNGHSEKNSRKECLMYSLSTGAIFDACGKYRVYNNLINSDFSTNQKNGADASSHQLALATHTSINNLHPLDSLVERWQNPLSVAIFPHGQDATFATAEVIVLHTFEIRHVHKMPATKSELAQLYQVGEVQPFYEMPYPQCQAPTNYSKWVNRHSQGLGPLDVTYTFSWVDPWEPFYIGLRTVPLYDGFRQYGFNRISQACKLHVTGYGFSVLNSAFVVHKGFKVHGEFHSRKDEEKRRSRLLFRSFKEGLKTKYPSSPQRC
uniref:Beta-1,4-glucuronyltransferase 1 n=2 Tax=Oncorhynchus kisutch TaxID=8019 RepID=A0A8C7DNZ5_ONCKI